ncbi:FAD/NAD(P)-binding protein, partial [Novilysobacter defluvii]
MVDVVVVGGGAAGAAVFGELIGRADAGCVHWVTGQGRPGRGVAYSTGEDHHLLNVRAAGMGLFDGPGSVFARHPAAGDAEPHQFVPRSRYGDYVQARLAERSCAARQAGRCFELHAATAVDAWRD